MLDLSRQFIQNFAFASSKQAEVWLAGLQVVAQMPRALGLSSGYFVQSMEVRRHKAEKPGDGPAFLADAITSTAPVHVRLSCRQLQVLLLQPVTAHSAHAKSPLLHRT